MRKYKFTVINVSAVLLIIGLTLPACGKKNDVARSSQVLAKVDGKEITISYFNRQMTQLPESIQMLAIEQTGKKAILEGMINREILYNEALKKGLDEDVELRRKMEDIKKELITTTLLQKEVIDKLKIDGTEVDAYYNNHPDEFKNRAEVRISQLVVSNQKTAVEVAEKLKGPLGFEDLVQKYSIDKPSALRRGDVGYFALHQLPQEVREDVMRMKPGDISRPFQISGNYEIYKVTDNRLATYSLGQVKDSLKAQLLEKKYKESLKALLDKLKKDKKIQINDSLLE